MPTEAQYEPTPEQIRRACAKIQAEWTDGAREKRAGAQQAEWTAPEVRGHASEPE